MLQTFLLIFNLFAIEVLLSIDNAAVLAIMVKDLPSKDRGKALKYGIWGAYIMRGLCLFLATILIKVVWLKAIGGAYLLFLTYGHFTKENDTIEEASDVNDSKIFKWGKKIGLSPLWSIILLIEIMDLFFASDNIFAAVALSSNFWIVMLGSAIGILAMRFVATKFVKLIERYPSLESSAFIVIGILGFKLIVSTLFHYSTPFAAYSIIIESRQFGYAFSAIMMLIFFLPVLVSKRK